MEIYRGQIQVIWVENRKFKRVYFSKLVYKEAHSLKFIENTATILMKTAYGIGKKSN